MTEKEFQYSKKALTRAGIELTDGDLNSQNSKNILDSWRACHIHPLNTFQTTLKKRLENIDDKAGVWQRLKTTPSILSKINRQKNMKLAGMNDIGGIRAVVSSMQKVRELEEKYRKGTKIFALSGGKDYIKEPNPSGYRSVHKIFRHKDGVLIKLQIRTQIQHAWATAVEIMGTFSGHSLKSSQGPQEWLDFFILASSAFAILENCPRVPSLNHLGNQDTYEKLLAAADDRGVREKLAGFRVAANSITNDKRDGTYHLVTLNVKTRTVNIESYDKKDTETANRRYSEKEEEAKRDSKNVQVVLVTSESVKALEKGYPSYFLDSANFIKQINRVKEELAKIKAPRKVMH